MGDLTKTDNAGKMSPGPVYLYHDQTKYDNVSYIKLEMILNICIDLDAWMVIGN